MLIAGLSAFNPLIAKVISLNGKWRFAIDSMGVYNISTISKMTSWRDAEVPLSWQVQFPELRDYQGIAWYKKQFDFPGMGSDQTAKVRFEAVDYIAEVFINSKFAGKHEGGYTPFEFDISEYVKKGNNEIVLRVVDPVANEKGTEGISYWNIPHGKQNWYVQTSGIWRDADIIIEAIRSVRNVKITTAINGRFHSEIYLSKGIVNKNENISFKIISPGGTTVFSKNIKSSSADSAVSIEGTIDKPELWSTDSPKLYTMKISL
ncbi:MAG: sugar-binding domain-containing protein, partial [Bacillota bacterium]